MPLSLRQIQPGSTKEIPCIFLHGFMGSSHDWARLDFPQHIPVYAIDLPGHGTSADDIVALNSFDRVSEAIYTCVVRAGLVHINLIGYSMGGRIALSVARFYPDLVNSLILESASQGIPGAGDRRARLESDQSLSGNLLEDPARFVRRWLETPIFSSLSDHPALKKQLIKERTGGPAQGWAEALVTFSQGVQPNFEPWLLEQHTDICIMTGALDKKYTETAVTLNRNNRRIRHICVPGAGHNVHLEQPDMYLAALSDVLNW